MATTLRQLLEEVREMVEYGASESDLLQKLKPYHDAYIEKAELNYNEKLEASWLSNPDRSCGQFSNEEMIDTGWH